MKFYDATCTALEGNLLRGSCTYTGAADSITSVSRVACTRETSVIVGTSCVGVAASVVRGTLVDICVDARFATHNAKRATYFRGQTQAQERYLGAYI